MWATDEIAVSAPDALACPECAWHDCLSEAGVHLVGATWRGGIARRARRCLLLAACTGSSACCLRCAEFHRAGCYRPTTKSTGTPRRPGALACGRGAMDGYRCDG